MTLPHRLPGAVKALVALCCVTGCIGAALATTPHKLSQRTAAKPAKAVKPARAAAARPAPPKVRDDVLQRWRNAKASGDANRLLSFYTPDFAINGKALAESQPLLKVELGHMRGKDVELKDVSVLRRTDSAETMVVTFGEVPVGARTGVTKRQYWVRQGPQWKIFFEGVVG